MSWRDQLLSLFEVVGINLGCKYLLRRQPRILMFHKIYPARTDDNYFGFINNEMFEELISYVNDNYNVYKLKDLVAYWLNNGVFPENAVVLTFDDGYKSFKEFALPVLEKYRVPATIFICPQLIENEETIWPDQLIDAFEAGHTSVKTRHELSHYIERLKKLDVVERSALMGGMIASSPVSINSELMSWEELEMVSVSNLIEIGSHSLTHAILANETVDQANEEIAESKRLIEERLGQKVDSFCYPNGQKGDFRVSEVEALKKSGYLCAVTSEFGLPSHELSPFLLPRFGGDFASLHRARKYIDGVELIQRKLINWK